MARFIYFTHAQQDENKFATVFTYSQNSCVCMSGMSLVARFIMIFTTGASDNHRIRKDARAETMQTPDLTQERSLRL